MRKGSQLYASEAQSRFSMQTTSHTHPSIALFSGQKVPPILAPCEHYAGNLKLINKAFELQEEIGPVFDVTCDCEDGAAAGEELGHAKMVAQAISSASNKFGMAGARVHDISHPAWRQDVDVLIGEAGDKLSYLTLPKVSCANDGKVMMDYIEKRRASTGLTGILPKHVLIETHGALRDVFDIAALPGVEVIDFGLMDFVSDHHGAIHFEAMRSPGQFEHPLLVRAKTQIVAAALASGVVPAHNVSLSLKDPVATRSDARRARNEFGFSRMWSVHPAQIRPIVEAMRPAQVEADTAGEILLAASNANWGPISYEGELHDRATYRYFWSVLKSAKVGGVRMSTEVDTRFFQKR